MHGKDKSEKVYLKKLMRWIEARGPQVPPDHLPAGHEPIIKTIWDMMREKDAAVEDFNKASASHDTFVKKIELAKNAQMKKMSQNGAVDQEKIQQLDEWMKQKTNDSSNKVREHELKIVEVDDRLAMELQSFLNQLMTTHGGPYADSVCKDLMDELESMFTDMNVNASLPPATSSGGADPVGSGSHEAVPELDATKVALEHVRRLQDGPQKTALLAVLEVAAVSPQVGLFQMVQHGYLCFLQGVTFKSSKGLLKFYITLYV